MLTIDRWVNRLHIYEKLYVHSEETRYQTRDAGGLCFLPLTQRYHKHPLVVEDEDEGGPEPPVQTQASPNRSKAEPEPLTHAELCSLVPGKTEETEIEMQVRNAPGVLMGHEKLDSGLLFCFLTFVQMFPSHRVTGKASVKVKPQPLSVGSNTS